MTETIYRNQKANFKRKTVITVNFTKCNLAKKVQEIFGSSPLIAQTERV